MTTKNILHRKGKYYVELIKIDKEDVYHVFYTGVTHSICESAYYDFELAKCRLEYLVKNNIKLNNVRL